MDSTTHLPDIDNLINSADRRTAVRKQLAALKMSTLDKLVVHKGGGIFTVNNTLIGMVSALVSKSEEFAILDDNNLPVMINDGKLFLRDIMARYQDVVNDYAVEYNKVRTSKLDKVYGSEE